MNFSRSILAIAFAAPFLGFAASGFAQAPPFNGGGSGVAFDPEISIVTSGALLDAQVVVSEDRRYVTINMRPSLSRLQSLDTFPASTVGTGGGGVAGGGGGGRAGGALSARAGFVGGAGFLEEAENNIPADVPKPAQSKDAAERAAHGGQPAPNTSQTPSGSSPTEILKTDPTAANSVLRKEGMFKLTSAK